MDTVIAAGHGDLPLVDTHGAHAGRRVYLPEAGLGGAHGRHDVEVEKGRVLERDGLLVALDVRDVRVRAADLLRGHDAALDVELLAPQRRLADVAVRDDLHDLRGGA